MVLKLLMRCCCCTSKQHGDDEKIDFGGGNVHVVTSKEDWDQKVAEANKDGKTVVANFSASWCGPCRVISPVYVEMSQTYPQLMFLTVDVDELMLKNVTKDPVQGRLGKVYMPDQEVGKLALSNNIKGLKRERREAKKN